MCAYVCVCVQEREKACVALSLHRTNEYTHSLSRAHTKPPTLPRTHIQARTHVHTSTRTHLICIYSRAVSAHTGTYTRTHVHTYTLNTCMQQTRTPPPRFSPIHMRILMCVFTHAHVKLWGLNTIHRHACTCTRTTSSSLCFFRCRRIRTICINTYIYMFIHIYIYMYHIYIYIYMHI